MDETPKRRGRPKKVVPTYVKPEKPKVVLKERGQFECQWCNKTFSSEKTVHTHMCEQRRRHQQKDAIYSRYGLQAYLSIQKRTFGNIKKSEEDYRKSEFYLACQKWGRFVVGVNCFNADNYLDWLHKLNVPVDKWYLEEIYTAWLGDLILSEDPFDALYRSIETMTEWASTNNAEYCNYFKFAGGARVLFDVQRGLVSGWVIYGSNSGQEWLSNLSLSDLDLIWSVMDVNRWMIKFQKLKDIKEQIEEICNEAGL